VDSMASDGAQETMELHRSCWVCSSSIPAISASQLNEQKRLVLENGGCFILSRTILRSPAKTDYCRLKSVIIVLK
jgi:hypothetical protein